MARLNVTPTRIELSNLKIRLNTSKRGHKLLKDKQDELMRNFIELIRENQKLRIEVEKELQSVFTDFFMASAILNSKFMKAALAVPKETIMVDIKTENLMSVEVPVMKFNRSTDDESGLYSYGYAQTNADLDDAIKKLYEVMDSLLLLAQIEKKCQLMADEIEQTRRRVNALEYRTIPDLEETIKYIRMKLDENERATITRLMKVKDLISKQAEEA
ncbi:MAG: V-type ATP synthase subunit D [Tissierellia bacterium]|nr:V-type ATP synthase subunit D [Tissierellia bacterium]